METFADILKAGGKTNSLGRANEVLESVLVDGSMLNELYECLFNDDAWVRMRAADCLEKVCRAHPDWAEAYVDKLLDDFSTNTQPSIQWHLAQIFAEVTLSTGQKKRATNWLKKTLSSSKGDWIVAVNSMKTLLQFYNDGSVTKDDLVSLFKLQLQHKSNTVRKKATQFLQSL